MKKSFILLFLSIFIFFVIGSLFVISAKNISEFKNRTENLLEGVKSCYDSLFYVDIQIKIKQIKEGGQEALDILYLDIK